MKRIVVVGPGPARPSVDHAASVIAFDLASTLAREGLAVAAVDTSPTSALLWPNEGAFRRYVEPVAALQRVVAKENADGVVAAVAGPVTTRALIGLDLPWFGSVPTGPAQRSRGAVVDVVVASDGAALEVLAAFTSSEDAGVALADSRHDVTTAIPPIALAERRGIFTVRCAESVVVDAIDTTLWPVAGLIRGVTPGALLAHLLLGKRLAAALAEAEGPRIDVRTRIPTFLLDVGRERNLGPVATSVGAILEGAPTETPRRDGRQRVLLVGPDASRPAQASADASAIALAARATSALGRETVVVTARDGTGAEAFADRVHVTRDIAAVIAQEAPDFVLRGFGADPALALDATDGAPPATGSVLASEFHATSLDVLVLASDEPLVLGTFEHVERASIHADDAAAVFPSFVLAPEKVRDAEARAIAESTGRRGLVTVRFAVGESARVVGATTGITTHAISLGLVLGVDVVAEAVRAVFGARRTTPFALPRHVAIEEHVFPFAETGAVDTRLGRRPRSTGAVLAIDATVAKAYARVLSAMGAPLARPREQGSAAVLLTGTPDQSRALADIAKSFFTLGFEVLATSAVAEWITRARVPHRIVDDAAAVVASRAVAAVVAASEDGGAVRREALAAGVACFTTIDLVRMAAHALAAGTSADDVVSLEEWTARD